MSHVAHSIPAPLAFAELLPLQSSSGYCWTGVTLTIASVIWIHETRITNLSLNSLVRNQSNYIFCYALILLRFINSIINTIFNDLYVTIMHLSTPLEKVLNHKKFLFMAEIQFASTIHIIPAFNHCMLFTLSTVPWTQAN